MSEEASQCPAERKTPTECYLYHSRGPRNERGLCPECWYPLTKPIKAADKNRRKGG
jgi:hypothetical protein